MTILLADDDPITLDSLAACLAPEGFRTLLAKDGVEALELWRAHKPDLLCLDVMMPRIDGYEVCRQIRASDTHVPILFLSAKSEEIDVVVGLRLGADDFIRKPFGKHELLARLHVALRRIRSQADAGQSFAMAGLRVFPLELRAEGTAGQADLTPREISILQFLQERSGEVISRDQLLDRCWGINHFPESRTLDQHIAKLRKKIELVSNDPDLIETVRGVGYRFRGSR